MFSEWYVKSIFAFLLLVFISTNETSDTFFTIQNDFFIVHIFIIKGINPKIYKQNDKAKDNIIMLILCFSLSLPSLQVC